MGALFALGPLFLVAGWFSARSLAHRAVVGLTLLARQPQVDRARLAVFGRSQGGIYAPLLASGLAGHTPKVRTVGR